MLAEIYQQIPIAVTVLASTGGTGAATAELIKQTVRELSGRKIPAKAMNILSGAISGGLCFTALVGGGISLPVAVGATVVAIFAPQPLHDIIGILHKRQDDGDENS